MRQFAAFILMAVLVSEGYAAPQFISFNDGKLGVNFGGYHAAVGLGGLLGQNGSTGGGLFAEAGTPYGQAAHAGLGGSVNSNGRPTGSLFAGATAGNKITAQAGLGGAVNGDKAQGSGFASAQAGNQFASSGLGGDASGTGASGYKFSGTKSFGITNGVVETTEVKPLPEQPNEQKVHKEFNFDAANEVNFVPLANDNTKVEVRKEVQPVVVKEVTYVQQPPVVVEKHIHKHSKPHHHHFHKTAYIGGYIGSEAPSVQVQPAIQRRADVGVEANAGASADAGVAGYAGHTVTKQVTFQRNPNFFADIFNIPISTLKAVGNFLGNAAGSTNVSVQKSATVHTDTDLITAKHANPSTLSASQAHVSVQTPNASKVIDDILAIPINTLGAVNKFLENNVPAKKTVQYSDDGTTRVRRGPHARRRGNKVVIVEQEAPKTETEEST